MITMNISTFLLVLTVCFATTSAQSQYFSDNVTTPSLGSNECRIKNTRICDPDDIIRNNTFELAQLINQIEYLGKGCGAGPGYKIAMAIVRSVPWGNNPVIALEQIARRAYAKWQIGSCGDAIIIASAAEQNVVYVVAETQAGTAFLNTVKNILGTAGPYFAQSHRIGLQYLLIQIKSVLNNNNNYRLVGPPYPLVAAASGQRSAATTNMANGATTTLVLLTGALAFLYQ